MTLKEHSDEASEKFIERLYGQWTAEDQAALEARLENDAAFAAAWRCVEGSWRALDTHAEAPELMAYRAEAISTMRHANARRWVRPARVHWTLTKGAVAAGIAGLALLGTAWQLSPYGYRSGEYRTAIGEQRIVELDDQSRITIDAATRLQVQFSNDARNVRLYEGQAHFSVAKDPARPFKVIAGNRTIVALGTVFTVEYVDRRVHVALLEGRVAVLPEAASQTSAPIELAAGEELRVARDGRTVVMPKADLEAATAWREGKVIFRTEPLGEAVGRMNRYSQLQMQIDDPALAAKKISGVFEAGDTRGFVNALQTYLPVAVEYSDSDTVRLELR